MAPTRIDVEQSWYIRKRFCKDMYTMVIVEILDALFAATVIVASEQCDRLCNVFSAGFNFFESVEKCKE